MPKFKEFLKLPSRFVYTMELEWKYLDSILDRFNNYFQLELNPEFLQKKFRWTKRQQVSYLEYVISGGLPERNVYFNTVDFESIDCSKSLICVDGLQRIMTILKFTQDKTKVFGRHYSEFEGRLPSLSSLNMNIASIKSEEDIKKWYEVLNKGRIK